MKKAFIVDFIYYFLILTLSIIFIKYILILILPVILGLIIFDFSKPFAYFLHKNLNLSKKSSSFLSLFIFYLIFLLILSIFITFIAFDIKNLYIKFPELYKNFSQKTVAALTSEILRFLQNLKYSTHLLQIFELFSSQITNLCAEISLFFAKIISNSIKALPQFFLNIILTILSSFFFALEYDFLHSLLKSSRFRLFLDIKSCIFSTLRTLFTSYAIIFSLTFSILSFGFFLIKIKNFAKIALFLSIFDLLPAVGIGFPMITWIIIEFLLKNTVKSFSLLTIYIVCVIARNIVEPKLLSDKIGISPLLTIICMIFCAKIFGILGAILSPFLLIIAKNLYKIGILKR